jgi:hypothetical protein
MVEFGDLREYDENEKHKNNDASQGYPSSPVIPARVVAIAIVVNAVIAAVKSVL